MPDKQNENKFMAMLERRGIVRKTGSEADSIGADGNGRSEPSRADAEPRPMYSPPAGDTTRVTPSARQPVPGMINPAVSPERFQQVERERTKSTARIEPEASTPFRAESGKPRPVERADMPKPTSFFGDIGFEDEYPADVKPVPAPENHYAPVPVPVPTPPPVAQYTNSAPRAPEPKYPPPAQVPYEKPSAPPEPPPVENYAERYLSIDELYLALSLNSKRTDTIYLIEEYLKTLPESLPDESRREIVSRIVAASGFDFDLLIGDGVLRVKALKEYAERFAKYTDDFVSARNAEVDELEQQIMRIRRMIENRRDLHKKQFFTIEAEAQRLKEILTFISG